MDIEALQRWVLLRLQCSPRALSTGYENAQGTRRDPPTMLTAEMTAWPLRPAILPPVGSVVPPEPGIRVPLDFDELIRTEMAQLPGMRFGPHVNGPIPLPIFVDPPVGMAAYLWEAVVEALLPADVDRDRVQMVRLARQQWASRPPFRLPLKVLAIGTACLDALQGLRSAPWYAQSIQAQAHGLLIASAELQQTSRALRAGHDVIITDEASVASVLRLARRLPRASQVGPRLVVFIDSAPNELYLATLPLPPGLSLLWIPLASGDTAEAFLMEFVYSLIHDFPLHEATKAAMRQAGNFLARPALLVADPMSNQDLRMSDALLQLHDDAFTLSQTVARGDLEAFFTRMGEDATSAMRSVFSSAFQLGDPIRAAIVRTSALQSNFQREEWGLVPLAETEELLSHAHEAQEHVRAALTPVLSNTAAVEAIQKHQDRRVDVTIEQLDAASTYQPINPDYTLVQGADYRLRVHIGQRAVHSLMVGDIPPLDPLLPEPAEQQGHTLEVVVFEKDFVLVSPRLQPLYLPLLQGSKPIYFQVRAPQRDRAELRLGIYHKNHLLQSFVLEAHLGTGAYGGGSARQVEVRLTFSRTARFTNLPQLAPRLLGIGVNENQHGAAHAFMFKGDHTAASIDLTEAIVQEQMHKFRQLLQEATFDTHGEARFATYAAPGTPPSADFEDMIRKLADLGNELYRALFIRASKAMQADLRSVGNSVDKTIQIVRYKPNFAFPWPILYDFQLPRKITGAPPPPICMGHSSPSEAPGVSGDVLLKGCSHGPRDRVYCIYGFWGVRHRVEQLMPLGGSLEDAVATIRSNPQVGVCLAVGTSDAHTTQMAQELRAKLANLSAAMVELGPGDDLLDLLWQSQSRPAVLIVLGHLETKAVPGEPPGPRIVLLPKQKWLQAQLITDRQIVDGDWEQPRTLVLLMACGSGATDITTLNDLVMALTSVGAAAIVGTECVAFSRLVARFAQEVTLDVWQGKALGEAVQAFNRRLVRAGNPLAFVFSYLGDADLTIVPQ